MQQTLKRNSLESNEERIARYLDSADEALRAAATTKKRETRDAHLAIAASWMQLAEDIRRHSTSR
jgi:hypothetical protein